MGALASPQTASKTVITAQRNPRMAILVSFIAQSHSGDLVVLHFKATAALDGRRWLKDCS
ncbi:hypothetical protein [Sphingomonas sp. Leaf205]|uniref:hypothetical protein n=1 Tax=Sphingomonas sp. Leaf205 TaxID=2876551 RepID=UPI001E566180|nr:hypothetical protein [Sphingomonas sp. Leaf205]